MEKVIYAVWRDAQTPPEDFARRLRGELAERLLALGARGLQVNTVDADVAPAAGLRQCNTPPAIDGLVQLWLDSANDTARAAFDAAVDAVAARKAAYLVTESEVIRNTRFPAAPGARTHGFSQLAFLQVPPRLTKDAWLAHWRGHHTRVAIETQDNFIYVQNLVVCALTPGAPAFDAIVEECFPAAAMTDPTAFFNAVGDPEKFQRNLAVMMDSCQRFIDFDRIDVIPSSQYVIR